MNAQKQYKQAWRNMRLQPRTSHTEGDKTLAAHRMRLNCFYGVYTANEIPMQAYQSFMARKAETSMMSFRHFIDCLESAARGLAWADRNHWYFMTDYNEELMFTNAEMGRFARYFKTSLFMTDYQFRTLLTYGAESLTHIAYEECEVYPVKPYGWAYTRWIIGEKKTDMATGWVLDHNQAVAKAKADMIADEFYAHCQTQQSDLRAEMEMQRYG